MGRRPHSRRRDLLWWIVSHRMDRTLPPAHRASTLGDLAEDYARRRARGPAGARIWLLREARSLELAYRGARRSPIPAGAFRPRLPIDELRHVWRRLVARPTAALLPATLLAIAIGLATAMFSVVDSLVLRPAPFPAAERIVGHGLPGTPAEVFPVVRAWRESGLLDSVEVAGNPRPLALPPGTSSMDWSAVSITPGAFDLVGARAIAGRLFDDADARGPGDTIVLSETVWRSAFGADEGLIGRRVAIDGGSRIVLGILPSRFRFPDPTTVAWTPLDMVATTPAALFRIFARLRPDVPFGYAETRLSALSFELLPLPSRRAAPPIRPIAATDLTSFTRQALWLLLAGVALVFIVLCANVSSLLLTELSARRREFGVCTALGASRGRLLRQATAEHMAIAAGGVALALLVAAALLSVVPGLFVGRTLNAIDIDLRTLAFASCLGMTAVVLSGLVPAWLGTRAAPADALRASSSWSSETRAARLAARGLVVAEVALASSLLVGSLLLVRSFVNLVNTDRGLRLDGVVQVRVLDVDTAFPSPEANELGTAALEAQVATWPEVETYAFSREVPPSWQRVAVRLDGTANATAAIEADSYRVGPGYFGLYEIPIVSGRGFARGDEPGVAVVGERLAAMLWPGQDAVGRTVRAGRRDNWRVIGVAREVRLPTIDDALERPEMYVPLDWTSRTLYLSLRCSPACPSDAAVGDRIRSIHPALGTRVTSGPDRTFLAELQLPNAVARIGGVFAIVAVLASAGGLFSVLSHAVARRRREFGIRMALGASPRQLRAHVLGDGLVLVSIGVAVGTLGGWLVGSALSAFHYGVTSTDPATWLTVVVALGLTSLGATWRPAREAMRVDPVTLLREE